MSWLSRIDARIKLLNEATAADLKDPGSPEYSREAAEDLLYNTIGPLTSAPRFSGEWKARGGTRVPEGYTPGGPAPQWTKYEITIAMAGDPSKLGSQGRNSPTHPASGKMGSPIYRLARRISSHYKRPDLLDDLYGNGLAILSDKMREGEDESRGGFISWVIRPIESAMLNGMGSSLSIDMLLGIQGTSYIGPSGEIRRTLPKDPALAKQFTKQTLYGLTALKEPTQAKGINLRTPEGLRRAASVVRGKFTQENSSEKHPDNPFRPFSASYYQVVNQLADAIEAKDKGEIEQAMIAIDELEEMAKDSSITSLGAATGIGQAITNKDRSRQNRVHVIRLTTSPDQHADAKDLIMRTKNTNLVDQDEDTIVFSMSAPLTQVDNLIDQLSKYGSAQLIRSETTGRVVSADTSEDEEATSLGSTIASKEDIPVVDPEIINTVIQKALTFDPAKMLAKVPRFKEKVFQAVAGINRLLQKQDIDEDDIKGALTALQYRYLLRKLGNYAENYPGKNVTRENTSIPRDDVNKPWWMAGEDPEIEPLDYLNKEGTWESIWRREGQPMMGPTEIATEMESEYAEFKELGIPTKKSPTVSKQSVNLNLGKALGKFMVMKAIFSEQLGLEESKQYDKLDRVLFKEGADFIINNLRRTLLEEGLKSYKP